MKRTLKAIIPLSMALMLSACASYHAKVMPAGKGLYKVVSAASHQGNALRGAMDTSHAFCHHQKKYFAIQTYKTQFYGKYDQQTIRGLQVNTCENSYIFNASTKRKRTNHDFVTTVTFRCLKRPAC